MILYLFFLILSFLPLIEGEVFGLGRFLLLASCLPLTVYLYKCKCRVFTLKLTESKDHVNAGFLHVAFIVFLFFALLTTIFSPVFARSFNTLVLYFAYFIYFLSAQILAREKKALFKDLLAASILFPSLVLCFLSFYLLLFNQSPPFSSMNLIYANFGHNHLVDYLIFAFPLSFVLFIQEKQKIKKIFFLLLNLIFLIGFVLSFSRGGILMAILIIFLFEFISWKKFWGREKFNNSMAIAGRLLRFSVGLLLTLVLGLSTVGFYYLGEEKIRSLNSPLLRKALRQPPFSSRIEYWRQAVLAFKARPLLGWGLDNFRYLSKKYQKWPSSWSWYAHNHFLQMFVETGAFGGLSFLILIGLILKCILKNIFVFISKGMKKQRVNPLEIALGIGVLTSIIHSLFDYDWQFPSVFLLFWVVGGYLNKFQVQSSKFRVKAEKTPPRWPNGLLGGGGKIMLLVLGGIIFIIALLEFTSNIFLFLAAENKKNYQKTEDYYQKSINLWPFDLDNWQTVISYYRDRRQEGKILNLLTNFLKLEPLNHKNFELIGDYYEKRDLDKAFDYYQKAAELNPASSLDIYIKLINIWSKRQEKDPQKLFQILTKIEKIKGKNCLLKCLGFENEEKILNLLLQLIKLDDFNYLNNNQQARVYFWLAVLTTYQKDWEKDINWLKKAIELDKKEEYQSFLADLLLVKEIRAYFGQKDYKQVEKSAPQIMLKKQSHSFHEKFYLEEIYFFLGEIYFERNALDVAEQYWQEAIKINPWNDSSYLGLAKIYQQKNDLEQARKILEECIRENNWSQDCKKELGEYY